MARFVRDPYLENVFLFCDLSLYWQTTPCYRNRLRLILPWLEARVAEGNQEPPRCLSLCVFLSRQNQVKKCLCVYLCRHASMDPCIHASMHTCMHTRTYAYTHTHKRAYIQWDIDTYHRYIDTSIHNFIHAYTDTLHIYTYRCYKSGFDNESRVLQLKNKSLAL